MKPLESEEYFFGACPECGRKGQVKHIGKKEWFFCAEHKTAWCTSSGMITPNPDDSDEDVTRFFNDGNYREVVPIYSALELRKGNVIGLHCKKPPWRQRNA